MLRPIPSSQAAADPAAVRRAPLTVVYASAYWRNAVKYPARACRHVFWDGSTLLANSLALAKALGWPAIEADQGATEFASADEAGEWVNRARSRLVLGHGKCGGPTDGCWAVGAGALSHSQTL